MGVDRFHDTGGAGAFRFALAGAALTATIVVAAGRVGPPEAARPFTSWGGLLARDAVWADQDHGPGVLLAVGLLGFVALWLGLVRSVRRSPWSGRALWAVGAAWLAPVALGPPILSNDVFSYVAQGAVAARGADPTRVSSYALGWGSSLLKAVDPMWRATPSPYGPLATLLQRGLVGGAGDHPVLAVIGLRVLTLVSVAAATLLARSLLHATGPATGDGAGSQVVLLVWANPLVVLHVVGGIHLEGLLAVLVLGAVRLALVRTAVADAAAVAVATAAAAVKLPVGGAVLAVLLGLLLARSTSPAARARVTATGAAVAVGTYGLLCGLAGSGWNVLAVMTTPASGRTPAAPVTAVAFLLRPLRGLGPLHAANLETTTRVVGAAIALAAIGFLAATTGRRPVAASFGLALLVLAAGSPVLYPWYLVWSIPLLAVTATGVVLRRLVVASAVAALMAVQGLTRVETVVVTSVVVVGALVLQWHAERDARSRVGAAVRARLVAWRDGRAALET